MGTWATAAEVTTLTGVTVTADQVVIAQGMIEGATNMIFDDPVTDRDLYWLTRAVAWQARYVAENDAAIALAAGVSSLSQDGMSVSWGGSQNDTSADNGTRTISPAARSYLNNLRFGANASVGVVSGFAWRSRSGSASWRRIRG